MYLMHYFALGIPLLFLAALWPPYNVLIAEAILRKDRWMLMAIPVSSVLGLSLSVLVIFWSARIFGIPLSLVGGIIVIALGIKMFFSSESEGEISLGEKLSAIFTVFVVSAIPGVYAFTAAAGLERGDWGQVLTVYLAGPVLGIVLGGVLLAYGFKLTRLPPNKVGALLLFFVGVKMIFS